MIIIYFYYYSKQFSGDYFPKELRWRNSKEVIIVWVLSIQMVYGIYNRMVAEKNISRLGGFSKYLLLYGGLYGL